MGGFLSELLKPIDPMLARRRTATPTPAPGLSQLASGPKSPLSTGGKLLRGVEAAGVGVLAGPQAGENFYRGGGGPGLGVMDDGGPVPASGPYNLEEGEYVVPARAAGAFLPGLQQAERNGLTGGTGGMSPSLGPTAAAILPAIGDASQRDRVPGSPALSELARNPGNLLLRPLGDRSSRAPGYMTPPARSIDSPSGPAPANIAPIRPAGAPSPLDSYANRYGRLRDFSLETARRESLPANADLAAAAVRTESTSSAAAPARVTPIGLAASRYAQDLDQTGLTAVERTAAGVPQTTRQKLLRGIEAAGVGVLSGRDAVPAALDFYNAPEKKAEQARAAQLDQDKAGADFERQGQQDTRQASIDELNRRNVESEIADRDQRAQPDDPADKKLDTYVNDQGQQTLIFQRPDGGTYEKSFSKVQGKTEKLNDPFQAFAYGSPEEKQAAKDFLTFEKKTGAQYEKPDEIEQRYDLYRKDPEAYKAMFGDRGGAQDQTQATRMLTYFDRRRKEIDQDWTLDEATRAQQLAEIDQLEQPYRSNPAGGGQGEDRVTVVSPSGQQGTIPRSQLPAARKKGYSVEQ